ncbi:histidinol-phosphate transaminase [Candidatus Nitronereus thalassa]|uniref:Histidinol-phosphate aminotransferase n=1 Tax=Candidatus Nitronereus thalassa TaxID=3020898 RepID=A0ABU3K9R6_9BACT|nr:histidinol-phosphate transaminase [Candidatus Nitronereus thalassa]MDT7043152.1 histidinol-phosphate transaminase [Candidatus Nitronereus thalassa]
MPLHVHPDIAKLVPYSPGKPLDELERELGIRGAVKLASNENPLGPSPKAIAALGESTETLHLYPDGGAHHLTHALADRLKVSLNQIAVGNGSDEIISLLVKAFVAPGDEAVIADHTFVMYKLAVTGGHGIIKEVPLKNWCHDLPAMAKAITDRTRLVFICNPNNPTGTIVTKDELAAFMANVPDHVIVVFDEAYYEYVRHPQFPDTLQYVRDNRQVAVLRTFSKIYGLAGLRIGYGVTTPEIVDYLHRVRNPFNTNALAQKAAMAALRDEEHVATSRILNESEMEILEGELRDLRLSPIPSQANFLYFDTHRDGHDIFNRLLKEGVIVRHIRGSMIRVTIGQPDENVRFVRALKKVLEESAASN